jgi:hypothetical protein
LASTVPDGFLLAVEYAAMQYLFFDVSILFDNAAPVYEGVSKETF